MGEIIALSAYKVDRDKYSFVNKAVLLSNNQQKRCYFAIALVDEQTKLMVCLTGLEKYIFNPRFGVPGESTIRIAVSHVTMFLNYLLHETSIKRIDDISIENIYGFLKTARIGKDGKEIKSDSWWKIVINLFNFLKNYSNQHASANLKYNIDELFNQDCTKYKFTNFPKDKRQYNILGLNPPKENDNKHRNRALMSGHLQALLYAAKKYDPMLFLALVLMAYSGLREGEVVNVTFADIEDSNLATTIDRIVINLYKNNRFRRGKSQFGSIKKIRAQKVYYKFVEKVREAIEFQKDYLYSRGYPTEGENPILYNEEGHAMSTTTLLSRIKALFQNYFLKILEKTSELTAFEGETYAYIEYYRRAYPGAHMLRHWFTMYLVCVENLRPEKVRELRGDSPKSNAYEIYLDINSDIVQAYKNTSYSFQEELMRDIYE